MITHLSAYSSDPHEHDHGDEYQISIPLSGTPFIELNKNTSSIHQNIRTITSPGETHIHFTEETESKILLINVNKHFVDTVISSRMNGRIQETIFQSFGAGASEQLLKIANEIISKSLFLSENQIEIEELEWKLVDTLLTLQEGSHSEQWRKEVVLNDHPIIKKLTLYIYENSSHTLTLDELVNVTGMSKFYLIRTFKEVIGCTPGQFITRIRLEKAIELLKTTKLDITTIAYQVGFGSLSTFERTFKKQFGTTVSAYRKQI
jgi:AraC-like DNA-binding protein